MQHIHHQTEPQLSPESIVSMSLVPMVSACSNDYTKIVDELKALYQYIVDRM